MGFNSAFKGLILCRLTPSGCVSDN